MEQVHRVTEFHWAFLGRKASNPRNSGRTAAGAGGFDNRGNDIVIDARGNDSGRTTSSISNSMLREYSSEVSGRRNDCVGFAGVTGEVVVRGAGGPAETPAE